MEELDSRGLPLGTSSKTAAEHYRDGVALLLAAWPGGAEALDEAIAADPDFALAHAARARLHAIRAEPAAARARIEIAAEKVNRRGSARAQSHVATLSLAIKGPSASAVAATLEHLDQWPRDAVILALPMGAFGLFAFSGMANHDQARVDLCERHAAHYADDDWWFLTYRGWSHVENGAVSHGRELAQRALDIRSANANAAHAVSHAMFEAGAGAEAERMLAGWLPGYDRSGILHGHLAWHGALAALERGDAERALAVHATHIQPSVSLGMPLNVMTDTVSLLWRMQAYGHPVPADLWNAAAAHAKAGFPKAGLAFADVHMALLGASGGFLELAEQRVEALTALVEAGALAAGPVVPAVCRAALAFAAEDHRGCVRILEPVMPDVTRIGGSRAQREIIEDMLLIALMRSGEPEKARRLLDERLHRRPSPRDAQWREGLAA